MHFVHAKYLMFHSVKHKKKNPSTLRCTNLDVSEGVFELCPLCVHGLVPVVHLFPKLSDDVLPLFQQPRQLQLQESTALGRGRRAPMQ